MNMTRCLLQRSTEYIIRMQNCFVCSADKIIVRVWKNALHLCYLRVLLELFANVLILQVNFPQYSTGYFQYGNKVLTTKIHTEI